MPAIHGCRNSSQTGHPTFHGILRRIINFKFTGRIFLWRGPVPWLFVAFPAKQSSEIKAISGIVTYGWGVIPADVQIGRTRNKTSLFPKDGRYLVPVKASVRRAESLENGDKVTLRLEIHL